MLISTLIFTIAFVALAIIVLHRVWEIRAGRFVVTEEEPRLFMPMDELEAKTEETLRKANIFFFHVLALSISHFLVFAGQVRESAKAEFTKFKARLPKHLPEVKPGSSVYLKDISAHKEEVRRQNDYHE